MNGDETGKVQPEMEEEDAISLLDWLLVFARHKKKILIIPFLIGCAVAVYSLQVPEIFSAETTLIPSDQKQSSTMAMLNQLGPMAGLMGVGAGAGNESEVLLTMVKSRRIQDKIIAKHNLQTVEVENIPMWKARENLSEVTTVSIGRKDGVITIAVEDENPKKAAQMANDYVLELEKLTRELALTEASQRRVFLEKQLTDAIDKLQVAEEGLKSSQEKSGLIHLDEQGRAIIEGVALLQAQIKAREVALEVLRLGREEKNPDVQRLKTEIQQMQSQLARMEHAQPGQQTTNSIKYWSEGKDEHHTKHDGSKSHLPNAKTETQKHAPTTAAELGISHPIEEHPLTWRLRATQAGSKVSWDKVRHELRGTHGAQLIYAPGRSNMATLTADRVVLDQQTGQARAEGNVRLERDGQTWSANFMEYNFRTKRFDRVHFRSPHKDRQKIDEQHHSDSNLTIQAAQIDVPMDAQILFHNAAQHQVTKSINILGQHE